MRLKFKIQNINWISKLQKIFSSSKSPLSNTEERCDKFHLTDKVLRKRKRPGITKFENYEINYLIRKNMSINV